ncbi:hypothetical protein G7046_g7301 [Stylonectria norvegica]|nr:hypothetical protein G7046_g7301 [Stylonectria norvegica]
MSSTSSTDEHRDCHHIGSSPASLEELSENSRSHGEQCGCGQSENELAPTENIKEDDAPKAICAEKKIYQEAENAPSFSKEQYEGTENYDEHCNYRDGEIELLRTEHTSQDPTSSNHCEEKRESQHRKNETVSHTEVHENPPLPPENTSEEQEVHNEPHDNQQEENHVPPHENHHLHPHNEAPDSPNHSNEQSEPQFAETGETSTTESNEAEEAWISGWYQMFPFNSFDPLGSSEEIRRVGPLGDKTSREYRARVGEIVKHLHELSQQLTRRYNHVRHEHILGIEGLEQAVWNMTYLNPNPVFAKAAQQLPNDEAGWPAPAVQDFACVVNEAQLRGMHDHQTSLITTKFRLDNHLHDLREQIREINVRLGAAAREHARLQGKWDDYTKMRSQWLEDPWPYNRFAPANGRGMWPEPTMREEECIGGKTRA